MTLYERLLEAARAFREVELRGFRYDVEGALNLNDREVIPRLIELTAQLRDLSGHSLYNPRSNLQTRAIMYEEWGLQHKLKDFGKKKLEISVGKEVREEIAAGRFKSNSRHRERLIEFAEALQTFVTIDKQRGTYIEGLIKRAAADGRIYCNFNVGGTVTGRPSSSDPNLQNITREGKENIPGIRTLFLPSEGSVIVSADYSQAELRTCAKLSRDENLLSIYRDSSRSLHRERATAFYGENHTKEEYVKSKNINFGVTYGQSAKAFAQMYHMPADEAQAYIDSWWREFPQLRRWTSEVRRSIKDGYVESPFGHRRRFHLITEENRGDLEREAVNFLPQNIAAWLTISSLVDLVDMGVPIVASVHDSIVIDCPKDDVQEVATLTKQVMENQAINQLSWSKEDIPFEVDISVGDTWGAIEEIDVEHYNVVTVH